jgi:putative transposase
MNRVILFSRMRFTLGQARPPGGGCHENLSRSKQIMNLVSGSHSIGQNLYHLEWCPKYRYNMFRGKGNKKLCEDILREVAERHNISVIELSVMPDHIHIVVQLPPTMSVSKALQLLKGASSYELFRRQPLFRYRYARGSFWSPGKFYRSVCDADTTTVLEYVKNQRLQQASLDEYQDRGLPGT